MNIGIVGLGYWGPNLVRNFIAHLQVKEVWGYDSEPARLKHSSAKFPLLKTASSFDMLLDKCDALVIATPVAEHYWMTKKALEVGKHVLVEKPFTVNVKEAQELVAIAHTKQLCLMVDHTFVFTTAIQRLKQMIEANQLGDLLYFDSVRINLGLFRRDCNVLWDLAYHDLSILQYLFPNRNPASVSAHGRDHFNQGMANLAYLTLNYDDGFLAGIHVSWLAPVKIRQIILGGSQQMVVYNDMEVDEKIKIYDKGVEVISGENQIQERLVQYRIGDVHIPSLAQGEALREVADHFIASIQEKSEPITSGAKSLEIVRIISATEESMKQHGIPVSMEN